MKIVIEPKDFTCRPGQAIKADINSMIHAILGWSDITNDGTGKPPGTEDALVKLPDYFKALAWTHEKPTEPGWYWAGDRFEPELIQIKQSDLTGIIDRLNKIEHYSYFAGPIPLPIWP